MSESLRMRAQVSAPSQARELRRSIAIVLKVVVVLLALDLWVRGPFFDSYIISHYVRGYSILRERTGGANLSVLFDAAKTTRRNNLRIATVGDSTMKAYGSADETSIPYLLRDELHYRLGRPEVEIVDGSIVGLYAGDAALFVDKWLNLEADVVVYGALLRAFPRQPETRWVTRIGSELGPRDLGRLARVGALPWLVNNLSAEQILDGLVHSTWSTYAYRTNLRGYLWENGEQRWPPLQTLLPTMSVPPVIPSPSQSLEPVYWTRAEFGFGSANWQALDAFGSLCHRYAPHRCLLYSGPINPAGRAHFAEPGLYDEYLSALRSAAKRYDLVFRDYTDALTAADFVLPMSPGGRAGLIHPNEAGRVKLAKLLGEAVTEIIAANPRHTGVAASRNDMLIARER